MTDLVVFFWWWRVSISQPFQCQKVVSLGPYFAGCALSLVVQAIDFRKKLWFPPLPDFPVGS